MAGTPRFTLGPPAKRSFQELAPIRFGDQLVAVDNEAANSTDSSVYRAASRGA